ncbi:H-NS family nucleoid-associated regulatory protein [Burkholderia ubonensis]|uniref:H-NS histone family protein n=1 Tax=Burkholderia ubonensis TaxID=101571 RepID=UPI000757EA1D|nr:H-NS histone family protein [Burkholderia ubonensis]KVW86366.1 hypothetical protein WK99_18315 [Burkholderia ubonensis]
MTQKSYPELIAARDALQAEIDAAYATERDVALHTIRQLMVEFAIGADELVPRHKSPAGRRPRYRDPATGATWSGIGRAPGWIQGRDYEAFLIDRGE